jgi:hypothetical protein
MPDAAAAREAIRAALPEIASRVNSALRGRGLAKLEPVLRRVGRGSTLPHWYAKLRADNVLPNLDGKTIGSVVEMLLVAVLETGVLRGSDLLPLHINAARGIDLPELGLGVKSPSKNYCTSEPFFSAYERLHGGEHDVLVLLTDYQTAKAAPPLRLQIIGWSYLSKTEIADRGLCCLAKKNRAWLLDQNESWAKKIFRFLAYVNQSDWRAKALIRLIDVMQDERKVSDLLPRLRPEFERRNAEGLRKDRPLIPDEDLQAIEAIGRMPQPLGIIDAADNWVLESLRDVARAPSDAEWERLRSGPLDGKLGMSFALQWRFNFGRLFGLDGGDSESQDDGAL